MRPTAPLLTLLLAVAACEKAGRPSVTPEQTLATLPGVELPSDPNKLAPLVEWAVDQVPASLRYWDIVNLEEALDFLGAGANTSPVFAGLQLLSPAWRPAPVRIARRQDENPCPVRVNRSNSPIGNIDVEFHGGCEASVNDIPIRYAGTIRLDGLLGLGGLRISTTWTDWTEESPFGIQKVSGDQTLESSLGADGGFSAFVRRRLRGTAGTSEPFQEDFTWTVTGREGEEAKIIGSRLATSGTTSSAMRADLQSTAAAEETGQRVPERVTDGSLELGFAGEAPVSFFSGAASGRVMVRLESVRTGGCRNDPTRPTAGRLIFESQNRIEAVFSDSCDGCARLTEGGEDKICWTEPPPPEQPTQAGPPPVGVEPAEPPAEKPETKVIVLDPVFSTQTDIAANQVTLASQDLALALPDSYRTVNVEGDVSGIFFDKSQGVRGFAVTGPSDAAAASKLADAFKKGSRINGTSLAAESSAVVSTVNSLRLTSVEGKPMTLQTFAIGFSSPRSWESVTAQIGAVVGADSVKTDISMPGVDVGSASGVASKDYIATLGSVPRDGGKSLHAAAVAPLDRFDEQSSEMFQTVAAATRASAKLAKREETFVAQAQGPQVTVSSTVVDVLWIIDDSGSMSEEQSNLATNFDAFFRQFAALNLDYHLGVVTTDCDVKADCGKLRKLSTGALFIQPNTVNAESEWKTVSRPGTFGSGNEKPLLAARESLTSRETDKTNAGFRRAGASLVVILVTDEVDQSYEGTYKDSFPGSTYTPPTPFIQFMQNQSASVFAITGDPAATYTYSGCSSANGSANPGNAVIEVAEATGGSWASICSSTFAPTLSLISQAIGTKSSRFRLSQPAIPSRIRVFVDGTEVRRSITSKDSGSVKQADGFIYDVASRTVSFVGTRFTPKTGRQVRVVYLTVE